MIMLHYYQIFLVVVVLLWKFKSAIKEVLTPRVIPGIPYYEDAVPLLGDYPKYKEFMKTTPRSTAFVSQVARELGSVCQIRLGPSRVVLVSDYVSAITILNGQGNKFDRSSVLRKMFGSIIPTGQIALPIGSMWKHHRRIVGPAMTSKYLSLSTPRINTAIANLIALWTLKLERSNGRAWLAGEDIVSAQSDTISGIAFGDSWGSLGAIFRQVQANASPAVETNGAAHFDALKSDLAHSALYIVNSVPVAAFFLPVSFLHFFTTLRPTYRHHANRLNKYFDAKITEARRKVDEIGPDIAVDLADNTLEMMVAKELLGEDGMTTAAMRDELFLYHIAGIETSSVTLSWYLTNSLEVQRKLHEHLLQTVPEIGNRPLAYEDLNANNTPYLEAVVYEILRLSRTAGVLVRDAMQDVVIMGKVIPKGSIVAIPTDVGWDDQPSPALEPTVDQSEKLSQSPPHKQTERKVGYWSAGSSRQFIPERWLDGSGKFNIDAGPSMPLGGGPRGCMGRPLALLTLRLFVAQLNHNFFFAPLADNLNSSGKQEHVTTFPEQCYVRPVSWDSPEVSRDQRDHHITSVCRGCPL